MDFRTIQNLVAVHGTPTLFLSEYRLRESYRSLRSALPGVTLYYAVKSNAAPQIVSILSNEGSYFDICSNGEIEILKGCAVAPQRCIHTHPEYAAVGLSGERNGQLGLCLGNPLDGAKTLQVRRAYVCDYPYLG